MHLPGDKKEGLGRQVKIQRTGMSRKTDTEHVWRGRVVPGADKSVRQELRTDT